MADNFCEITRLAGNFGKITYLGSSGLEPPTSRLSGVRSNRLSYEPFSYAQIK